MSNTILSKEDAEKRVVAYTPREFPYTIGPAAVDFVRYQTNEENPSFKIDNVVAATTGIAELEKTALSERVEAEALERLKLMQEEAYRHGYDLGRDEGQETAYLEKSDELSDRLRKMDKIIEGLEQLKMELVRSNEASLVLLIYQIANKLAMTEIADKRELILSVLRAAAQDAQDEESLTIRLAKSDLEFIESNKVRLGQEFEFMKKAKLETADEIREGGCVVVTNFGQVDATIEKRLEKVWTTLAEKLPKTTDVVSTETTPSDESGTGTGNESGA